jgi:hypothetical protein
MSLTRKEILQILQEEKKRNVASARRKCCAIVIGDVPQRF